MSRSLGIASRSTRSILWVVSPAVAHWKPDSPFWNTICRRSTSGTPSEAQNTDAILRSRSCPNSGYGTMTKRGLTMLVKLQTAEYLIYAELNKTERARIWHLRTASMPRCAMRFFMRSNSAGIFRSPGALRTTGIPTPSGFPECNESKYYHFSLFFLTKPAENKILLLNLGIP